MMSIKTRVYFAATHHNDGQIKEAQVQGHPQTLRNLGQERRMHGESWYVVYLRNTIDKKILPKTYPKYNQTTKLMTKKYSK